MSRQGFTFWVARFCKEVWDQAGIPYTDLDADACYDAFLRGKSPEATARWQLRAEGYLERPERESETTVAA